MPSVLVACDGADTASAPRYTDIRPGSPNLLIVITDDQRASGTLQAMPAVREHFWEQGTRFTRAYATTPLCCPSRSSIFTGRYAHSHRVQTNYVTARLDHRRTLQAILQRAGYRTAVAGKYLNRWEDDRDPPYFDRWSIPLEVGYEEIPFNDDGAHRVVEGYTNDFIEVKALEYLDEFERDDEQPWFMMVGTPAAHALYEPEPAYEDAELAPWHGNRAMHERDLSDKPTFVNAAGERFGARRVHRLQLRTLMSADDLVEALFDRLDAQYETTDTIAVFLSDNGQMWGDHGITGKRGPYLGSVQVPLLIRWPGRIDPGTADARLAATIDVAPTVLDAIGASVPGWMDGRSLLGSQRRSRLLLEHWTDVDTVIPDWAATLTRNYQYIEYYSGSKEVTFQEYYDLRRDPWQLRNLLGDRSRDNDPDVDRLSRRLAADRGCRRVACP